MSKAKELLDLMEARLITESVKLPSSSEGLTNKEVAKMLYLASGWVKDNGLGKHEKALDKIALEVYDYE